MTTTGEGKRTGPQTDSATQDFTEQRRRRAELLESINALEQALAAPGQQLRWVERVSNALFELSGDLSDHVDLTEGPGGLYSRVLRTSPRLAHHVDRLTQEHTKLTELIGELRSALGLRDNSSAQPDASPVEPMQEDPVRIRECGTKLMGALVRHRQRGADLMYEAYSVDIGGQD